MRPMAVLKDVSNKRAAVLKRVCHSKNENKAHVQCKNGQAAVRGKVTNSIENERISLGEVESLHFNYFQLRIVGPARPSYPVNQSLPVPAPAPAPVYQYQSYQSCERVPKKKWQSDAVPVGGLLACLASLLVIGRSSRPA